MQFAFSNDYFKLLRLHRKPYFLFPDVLKWWSFQKNCAGIWFFLYFRERWYFFSTKIWSYPLCGKWKMIILKKIHEDIFSSNVPRRWSFQEELRRDTIFLALSGKMAFFSRKRDISSLVGKWEMIFLKKYVEIWYFLWRDARPPLPNKNQKWSCPVKIHLKVTDVLDWHSRKSPGSFLYFRGTFTGVFTYCSPAKKSLNI